MRLPRVVAGLTLIVALATVAVPGSAGSRTPTTDPPIDPTFFQRVDAGSTFRGTAATTFSLDPANRSDGSLEPASTLLEPAGAALPARHGVLPPKPPVGVIVKSAWQRDASVSWYGPGFYGKRTACGYALTTSLIGVANRSLPCGTLVRFRNPANGRVLTVPVVDRGPYVTGRQWDLTGGACKALGHCYTGPIDWRLS